MKNRNFKNRHVIVGLLLAIGGIIFLYISQLISTLIPVLSTILNEVGSAILISGILGLVDAYLLKESLIELILSKINIKEEINKTGLEELLPSVSDVNYKYYIKNANKNIDIIHIYGQTWTNNNLDEIAERVLRGNCKVRIILVDPNSLFTHALEKHFKYQDGELSKLINTVSKMWKMVYEKKQSQSKRSTQGTIKLYYHLGQPTNSIYRIDDRIIVVQTKSTQEKTKKMPVMIFKDINKNECFYNIYLREIEQLIKEAKEIDFSSL